MTTTDVQVVGLSPLFRTAHDAQLFAYAVQADSDATVHILPSAEVE